MKNNFIGITLRHGRSPVNLLYIFRTFFLRNTSGWLLLLNRFTKNNHPCYYVLFFFLLNTLFAECRTRLCMFRSRRLELFYKKGVLKKLPKLTGNTCVGVSFFNRIAGLRHATLLKRYSTTTMRIPFFTEHLRWLLLHVYRQFSVLPSGPVRTYAL